MSGVQNWSRCSRQASRNICRHSCPGSTRGGAGRGRSSPLSRPGSSFGGLPSGLEPGPDDAQPVADADGERLSVEREAERVAAVADGLDLVLLEVPGLQVRLGRRLAKVHEVLVQAALRLHRGEEDPALRAEDAGVDPLGHRESDDRSAMPSRSISTLAGALGASFFSPFLSPSSFPLGKGAPGARNGFVAVANGDGRSFRRGTRNGRLPLGKPRSK